MTPPDPGAILAMWAAGLAAGVAVVSSWKVARPGFVLLGAGVCSLLGGLAALAGAGLVAWVGTALCVTAGILRSSKWSPLATSLASLALLFAAGWSWLAINAWGLALAVVGALALGGITAEMLLGHWYLVDPKLPRWPLRRLAIVGGIGMVADAIVVASADGFHTQATVAPGVLLVLSATTVLLMVAVWFSLKGKSYTGVMAATGLSYLATLTALGAVVLGRANVL